MVDFYMWDVNKFLNRIPSDINPIAAEMEAFSLFYVANFFGKKACCLMCVVDSLYVDRVATIAERQNGLNNMIKLALESSIKF